MTDAGVAICAGAVAGMLHQPAIAGVSGSRRSLVASSRRPALSPRSASGRSLNVLMVIAVACAVTLGD